MQTRLLPAEKLFKPTVFAAELCRHLRLRDVERTGRVADLGCGTGVLARHLAEQGATRVVGIDIDSDSIRAARAADREGSIEWVAGDIFSASFRDYQLMVMNPPWFPSRFSANASAAVRFAFAGGPTGNEFVRDVIERAGSWLADDGRFVWLMLTFRRSIMEPHANAHGLSMTEIGSFSIPCAEYLQVVARKGVDGRAALAAVADSPEWATAHDVPFRSWLEEGDIVVGVYEAKKATSPQDISSRSSFASFRSAVSNPSSNLP